MTHLLERAFKEASKLSPEEQDAVANALLKDLASEKEWEGAFEGSLDALSRLADEALEEHRTGQTEPLDPERMLPRL